MPLALTLSFSCSPDAFAQSIVVTGDTDPTLPADGVLASDLFIGDTATGSLSILDGASVSNWNAVLGNQAGGDGTVTVGGTAPDGTASTWNNSGYLEVGFDGRGTLTIENGGVVTSASGYVGGPSSGAVEVTGTGSSWTNDAELVIGNSGQGTLTIANGGSVFNGQAIIGQGSTGEGEVIVTGEGSSWSNSDRVTIGNSGTGKLRLEDGATLTSVGGILGSGNAGEAIVTGGATWTNTAYLDVGSYAAGTLTIEDGGAVSSAWSYIGAGASSTGVVTVTGAGSSWVNDSSITIANFGTGTLTIADGGHVRSGGLALALDAASSGTLTLSGSATARSVLEVTQIGAGAGSVDFTIDGGILRSLASSSDFTSGFEGREITIGANGAIIDTDQFDIRVSADLVGGGSLEKIGSGSLTLTGAGSEVGTLNVQAGTLEIAAGASFAAQTIDVAAGTTVRNAGTFGGTALADVVTVNGTMAGRVEMFDGDDRVVIADGADISAAHFDGGAGVDTMELTHGAALTIDDSFATNFEHLLKHGNGALTFDGAINGFSDSITIAAGSAHLSNAVLHTNHLQVSAGTTLTGVGSISGALTNDGVLSAGNSPGTIQVGGNFTQSASGTLVSEIQRNGNDLIDIAGTATLAGTHRVQIDYGLYLDGTTQTVLQAAGGVSGSFENVTINPSALMTATHQIGANDVTVSFERQATTTVTTPGTDRDRFATWLDDQITGGTLTPELSAYIDTLLQQPTAEEAENLLGELAEPAASVVQDSVSTLGAGFASAVFDRFANDSASCIDVDEKGAARNCGWVRGLRQWGDVDGDRFGPRYDRTTDGVQIGVDHSTSSSWTFGISAGYADTNTHDVHGGRNALRSTLGGVYTNYTGERINFGAVAMYASHENRTTRNSTIRTDVRQARAEFDYDSLGVGLRVDYRLTGTDRAMVRPFVEAFYDRIDAVSFAEQGAAAGNLSVHMHEREGLRGTVGVQVADDYVGYGLVFRPMLEVGIVHQFLDTQSALDLYPFAGASAFRAYSVQQDRTSYRANASLGISLGTNSMLSFGYGGEVAAHRSQQGINLGFRVVW
ncbi:autotransporter domain-containing protein [Steroidobacter cummioxidans]|uniref:autotransporter domain-containing protein n=1 Tax=Steroidobacter cummioxidans TaxID=1803913 RepID=UPI00137AE679|nr:autotransporter domain-containing protein [Steroidobacter cummioxidans]